MSTDLAALIAAHSGEVTAVKAAMVRAFRSALPKSIDVYYGVPGSMELPCITVGEVQITPNGTFGGPDASGMETMVLTVSVFTSNADDEDGQRLLDALLSRRGPVRAAIWAMRGEPGEAALDGAADDLSLYDISGYGMISIGDNGSAYGANLSIRVIVS
jgi:hypothetical protein